MDKNYHLGLRLILLSLGISLKGAGKYLLQIDNAFIMHLVAEIPLVKNIMGQLHSSLQSKYEKIKKKIMQKYEFFLVIK